jgi:adenylate cyclase
MSHDALEREITAWLIGRGLTAEDEALVLDGLCARLLAAGVPLWRVASGSEVLHPILDARGCRWRRGQQAVRRRGQQAVREDYSRGALDDAEAWLRSPFRHLVEVLQAAEFRCRLDQTHARGRFPLLDQWQDEGSTDYVAFVANYHGEAGTSLPPGMVCSFQTDRPGGFRDDELLLLRRIVPALALACKAISAVETARTLVATYLGEDAGRRVLEGAIARGVTETVRAVLWYSDLEGFTRVADTAPGEALIAFLNAYAETVVERIHAEGGQVLKFMGDGILAMFPLRDDASPCARALDAAEATLAAVERLGQERAAAGLPTAGIHIALHVGDVLYGNIGSRDRLDFTVVGPAVNEAARIEALCRSLDQRVIVSSAFAAEAGAAGTRLVSLGRYALKGVRRPEELFTLDPQAC